MMNIIEECALYLMRYEGYTEAAIAEANTPPDHSFCERRDGYGCQSDEEGKSYHQLSDKLGEYAETARVMLEVAEPLIREAIAQKAAHRDAIIHARQDYLGKTICACGAPWISEENRCLFASRNHDERAREIIKGADLDLYQVTEEANIA
jgi:hypothetical protein